MLYDKDKELIHKLQENAKGNYQRFSCGDVEYIVHTIKKCAKLEDKYKLHWLESLYCE